jgi:hypothetical protein
MPGRMRCLGACDAWAHAMLFIACGAALLVRMLGRMRCRMWLAHRRMHLLIFSTPLSLALSLSHATDTSHCSDWYFCTVAFAAWLQQGCNRNSTQVQIAHSHTSRGTVFSFAYTHSVAAFVALLLHPWHSLSSTSECVIERVYKITERNL